MAATPIATGHGAVLLFGTSITFVPAVISISGFEMARGDLDKSHLGSGDYREFIPGDITDPGEFTVDFFYDANSQPPFLADPETITIRLVDSSAGTVHATTSAQVSGTGYIKSWSTPEVVTGTLMRCQVTIKWSGALTFRAET